MPVLCGIRAACRHVAVLVTGALGAAVVAGCAAGPATGAAAVLAPPAPLLGPAAVMRVGADEVPLLRRGAATFQRLRLLIDGARASVQVEVYELGQPVLIDALLAAHARGVAVTVIDDPSELSSAATAVRLRAAGVDVAD